jgi:ribosomal-protein-alanine N-acetyltransferase
MAWRGAAVFTSPDETQALLFHWRRIEARQTGFRIGIEHKQTAQLIGTAGFKHINHTHRSGEIGYELLPAYWNRGYMTEALKPIIELTAAHYHLHTVTANIDPAHTASKRVLEKLGFVQEAHFRENYFFERWWNSAIWVKHI